MSSRSNLDAIGCLVVADRIARSHGSNLTRMLSRSRLAEDAAARGEMMMLLHDTLAMGWSQIGRIFECDHTTVMNAVKRRREKMQSSADVWINEMTGGSRRRAMLAMGSGGTSSSVASAGEKREGA